MTSARFKPAFPSLELSQTYSLHRTAAGIGFLNICLFYTSSFFQTGQRFRIRSHTDSLTFSQSDFLSLRKEGSLSSHSQPGLKVRIPPPPSNWHRRPSRTQEVVPYLTHIWVTGCPGLLFNSSLYDSYLLSFLVFSRGNSEHNISH